MERTTVTVHKPRLEPEAAGVYIVTAVFKLLLRTTMIWAGFAILVPALGIAWYMVFIALVMLNHLLWMPREADVISANDAALRGRAAREAKEASKTVKMDNQIFAQRVNS